MQDFLLNPFRFGYAFFSIAIRRSFEIYPGTDPSFSKLEEKKYVVGRANLAFACDSSKLAICYIPHSGIVNKISDYVKICQRLTNLPCNVGGIREDKIAWGTWLKLQNKYPTNWLPCKSGDDVINYISAVFELRRFLSAVLKERLLIFRSIAKN